MKRNYDNMDPGRGRTPGRTRGRGYQGGRGGRGRGYHDNRRGSGDYYGGGRGGRGNDYGGRGGGYYGSEIDDHGGYEPVYGGRGYDDRSGYSGGRGGGSVERDSYSGGRGDAGYYGGQGDGGYSDDGCYGRGRGGGGYHDGGRGAGRRAGGRGGNYDGGNYGGREGRRGGRGRGGRTRPPAPDMSDMNSVLSNVIMADVSEHFQFFMYSVQCLDEQGTPIESRHRRKFLFDLGFWNGLLADMDPKEKHDLRRVVFFQGSMFYCTRQIPGLEAEKLAGNNSILLPTPNEESGGETILVMQVAHYVKPIELQFKDNAVAAGKGEVSFDKRCADCTSAFKDTASLLQHCQQKGHKPVYGAAEEPEQSAEPIPANIEHFTSFVNLALQRALGERLARWGNEYIDPMTCNEPTDKSGRSMGVRVYEAYSCQFGAVKATSDSLPQLGLTVDLRAKIVRTMSVMDYLVGEQDPNAYDPSYQEQEGCRRQWIGEVIISMHDKKCYSVTDLVFDRSAADMPVQGLNMTHAEYFEKRKNIKLKYPNFRPLIAVLGRRNQTVYFPAELVAGNELEPRVKQQLPMIASYKPEQRNEAIEKVRAYLIPGAQKSKGAGGLLPAIGIQLADSRLAAQAEVLQVPMMMAAGIQIPSSRAENWAPVLSRAKFNIEPKDSNSLHVIVFYNERIRGAIGVYNRIRDIVNGFSALYRFGDQPAKLISAGDRENHWGAVEQCFSDKSLDPENVFVLDFNKPKGSTDPAYPVIKQILTKNGFISQFVNFNTYAHDNPRDQKRSDIILQGVARQILQKMGIRLWWVQIPQSLPTPTVMVGVDVFHAPRVYDPVAKKRVAKASCAAVIVQVFRETADYRTSNVELYSRTFAREPGNEFQLGDALQETVSEALKELNVSPTSCVVWRDGIGEAAFQNQAREEIDAVRAGLRNSEDAPDVPLAYVVAQKRISTKFLSKDVAGEPDGKFGAPSGTLVRGMQGLDHEAFYLNGRAPPYSTAKPVRYVIIEKDDGMKGVSVERLAWNLSHDYPNWTGPVKVPSAVQMAHKLAELGGSFADCGVSINSQKLKNKLHFL